MVQPNRDESGESSVSGIDLGSLSLDEILALRAQANELIVDRLIEEQVPLREEYRELMERITEKAKEFGLTADHYLQMGRAELKKHMLDREKHSRSGGRGGKAAAPSKIKPKYRHPTDHSLTWTGRGNKPHWVQAWLADHGSFKDLEIPE